MKFGAVWLGRACDSAGWIVRTRGPHAPQWSDLFRRPCRWRRTIVLL